ncbi:hypothetical protein GBAR_LOCUS22340 [Geodia barretti]|uniref:Uncharacterized protein n=1 Tax=Geodia barretti TaxID=519541 RepID=A0AA35T335_GEOBA|nr:hypothetical protein GBAR_LOCUS22340 [Geodia barretti]
MGLLHLSLLLLILSSQSLVQPLRVYIDGAEGNDSLECLNSSSIETPCQSLSFVSQNLTQKHFVAIEILGDVLNLTRAVDFTDYSNLTISGSGSNTTLHCNEADAGLAFVRVVNLSMFSFTVQNCGAPRPSTTHPRYLPIAVYVLNSSNVSLSSVDIVSSNGTGLSMYDTNGEVGIAYCNFVNNSLANKSESGGGGLYIEFTICTPGFTGDSCNGHNDRNKYSSYNINHCNFTNNSASSPQQANKFILPSQQVFVPRLGKGGGLYISLGSNAADNVFRVNFCTFKNNQAVNNGGGMIAEFLNSVERNRVIVSDTSFIDNVCMQTQFSDAGGLTVGFIFYITEGEHPQDNTFECHFCSFKTNRAHMGGGTAIFATKDTRRSSLSSILFSNCDWIENESAMGAAVFITPAIWDYTKEGYLPVPKFQDCHFESNSAIQQLKPPMAEGIGVEVKSTLTFVVQAELTGYVVSVPLVVLCITTLSSERVALSICATLAARTTFHILNPSCLYSANFSCRVKVVHLAGHLTYFEGEHIPYVIAAILVLLFMIVIPPLLLVSYPLVFKLFGHCNQSETKPVTILWRMMPIQFLDAFQSSFKDKYRFFAGLYFLYRAAILAFFVGCQSWLEFYTTVQLLLIVITTVHFVIQPHKERKHNIVDSLLFANLSLINAITLYYYGRTEVFDQFRSEMLISSLAIVQAALIILPLLVVIILRVVEWKMRRKRDDYEGIQ